jgi:two-component system, OmpR family, sensor histidine kinase VanS
VASRRLASARLGLALSYAGFVLLAGTLLLAAAWVFLLRGTPATVLAPHLSNVPRVFDPSNFGPAVFGTAAVVVVGSLLVFGLVGGWLLAGHMLAPLARITDAARKAAGGSLSHRIHWNGRDDEFRELADAFDMMLARLEAQLAEQQRFAANASHELRTPLTIMQAQLDVARAGTSNVTPELIDRLHATNSRAIALTEALLMLSRAEQKAFVSEVVDLSLLVEEAMEALVPLADARHVVFDASSDVACVEGSPTLLRQLAGNLLHNAIVHGPPGGGTVRVHTYTSNGKASLRVANDGPVLASALAAKLQEPFQRGDARVRSSHDGTGLGLAIVASIVRAHGGVSSLVPREGGGLEVTVHIPRRPTPES